MSIDFQRLFVCASLVFTFACAPVRPVEELNEHTEFGVQPPGYKWTTCPYNMLGVLKPSGWFVHEDNRGFSASCFISKEEMQDSGGFSTGFTINVLTNFKKLHKAAPSAYAERFMNQLAAKTKKSGGKIEAAWKDEKGPLKSFGTRYSGFLKAGAEDPGALTTVHAVAFADDKRSILYLIMFESPKEDWPAAWKIAETVIQQLRIPVVAD